MLKVWLFLSSILFADIVTVWLLITARNEQIRELGKELGILTGQAVIVAVIGGIVVQEYTRRRERTAAINEFKKTILKNLVHSYGEAKKSRRLLRARCRVRKNQSDGPKEVKVSRIAYEEQMGSLSETQLAFEVLIVELNTYPDTFARSKEIRRFIDKMEKYLGGLITEYETSASEAPDGAFLSVDEMERLSDFIHGRRDGYFRRNFTSSFHEALKLVQGERLGIK
jgi:hypothetical protein